MFGMKKRQISWIQKVWESVVRTLRWLVPGLGVKRWLLLVILGTTLFGVGLAFIILDVYRNAPDTWWLPLLSTASLRSLARPIRALIFGLLGTGLILGGLWGFYNSLFAPFRRSGKPLVDELSSHRKRGRGPRIVAIGGGHGLATLLRGLKTFSYNITAVVTVADDGGSSGRLREMMGILPPGDIRNCLAALSDDEALMSQLFQYRFGDGVDGLEGHSFGNLLISVLVEITGSFERAVAESGRVLAVHGEVLPATLHDVRLVADVALPHTAGEVRVEGESHIPVFPGAVHRVWLEPNNPVAYPQVIQAILGADLIVIGPGSLYTSLLPNLLVPDIAAAIHASRALKIYVCNIATEIGETEHYLCGDHIRVMEEHVGGGLFDIVVCNSCYDGDLPENIEWVVAEPDLSIDHSVYSVDLTDKIRPWRHESTKLAQAIMDLYQQKTGPLVE
jgi:uncharacterized cofD-like protein